jgi:hypothetical protein
MKLSVSVPDDLWTAAVGVVEDGSPSAVVQSALTHLVARSSAERPYAQRPDLTGDLGAQLEAARDRFIGHARTAYEDGYRKGVQLSTELTWDELEYVVKHGAQRATELASHWAADVEMNQHDPAREQPSPPVRLQVLAPFMGAAADYTGSVSWRPSATTVEGLDRALRDLWDSVQTVD